MRTFRVPLRAVFYREEGVWFAHCLEMDVIGDGPTPEEALAQLSEAIGMQIEFSLEQKAVANVFRPADARLFEMFAAGKDFALGELKITPAMHGENFEVQDITAREYDEEDCAIA
jgi:predicted RNase H-like HicB family nuclease